MRATHKLTYLFNDRVWWFHTSGDEYYWSLDLTEPWQGPFTGFKHYIEGQDWLVEKINIFKGNK